MNNLINFVKFTGGIGVVGVFVPQDPNGSDALEKEGKLALDWGMLWFKGHRVATGQCNVKANNRQLRDLIHAGRAKPSFIVSHELKLDQAPDAYQHFDLRDHGWTKVVLHPGTWPGRSLPTPYKIPDDIGDEDAVLLTDALATGYQAAEMGDIKEGDTVVVSGAGPVGIFAARSRIPWKTILHTLTLMCGIKCGTSGGEFARRSCLNTSASGRLRSFC